MKLWPRFIEWLSTELTPGHIARGLAAVALNYVAEIITIISFAALIFSGDLSSQLPSGIGFLLMGDAIICFVVAFLSSQSGFMAGTQDAACAIMAVSSVAVLQSLPPGASVAVKMSTVLMMMVLTTLSTGVFFTLLGYFRLGGLARFLPFPVMGGFLAGTGWLLVNGGIGFMVGAPLSLQALNPAELVRWLPGLAFGILLMLVDARFKSTVAIQAFTVVAIILFYGVAFVLNAPVAALSANGWLVGPFSYTAAWQFPLSPEYIAQADWPVLLSRVGTVAPLLVVSVVGLLLNASGLELVLNANVDLNHELVITGLGNILAGLGGGMAGYHAISASTFNFSVDGGKRLPGMLVGVALAVTVFVGVALFSFFPKMVLGGLLVYGGLALLVDWVYKAWVKFPRIEFVIILVIVAVVATRGFLEGIGVGVLATIILFIVSYSRVNVVKHALTGESFRSRVNRSIDQLNVLGQNGQQLYLLQLQGFIFFGTAIRIFEQIRDRVRRNDLPSLRFMLLDFTKVTGLDSTALLSFSKILHLTREMNIVLVFTGLPGGLHNQFSRDEFHDDGETLRRFIDLDHGAEWCEEQIIGVDSRSLGSDQKLLQQLEAILPGDPHVARVVQYMERRQLSPGEVVIQQDDLSDVLFFIESGQVTAQLESPNRPPVRLESMRGGRTVGELGFYLGTKRAASVIADETTVVYCLTRQDMQRLEQIDAEAASTFHRIVVHLLGERIVHLIRTVDALQRS